MKVGYRTLKTAIGTGCSIWLAQLLGLKFYVAAGIITILCIKPTKRQSLKAAGERLLACLVGLTSAVVFFELFGYHPWILSLVLLCMIPVCVKIKLADGIISSFVIVLHLYVLQDVSYSIVLNEIALIVIGIGFALLLNLYMPSMEKDLIKYQEEIEEHFKKIFTEFVNYLRYGKSDWDGKEIIETTELLKEAKFLASKEIENHLTYKESDFYTYFYMREKQFDIIVRLLPMISSLTDTNWQTKVIADFLDELKEAIHPGNTAEKFLDQLMEIREQLKETPLPKNHKEFEIRATLFHLVNEMERYLFIKKSFIKKKKGKE